MKKEFGRDHLYSEIFIEDDEPYVISTINYNNETNEIKVSYKKINQYFRLCF
jgi:hypothetical protein